MGYTFGPVPSRRLGRSLGVDLVPPKTCTLDCVYCEAGPTTELTLERRSFFPPQAVLDEVRGVLERGVALDAVTLSGAGEPTLNSDLGLILQGLRRLTPALLAVLTNGTLLWLPEVRAELAHADLVMPSFDACLPDAFERVNLPAGGLTLERYRQGLLDFVRGFHGRVWLEVLLVQGLNDRPQDLEALGGFVASLPPVERVQLNTVVRAPARREARPVTREALEALRARLSEVHPLVEVIGTYRAPEPERPGPYGHGR